MKNCKSTIMYLHVSGGVISLNVIQKQNEIYQANFCTSCSYAKSVHSLQIIIKLFISESDILLLNE